MSFAAFRGHLAALNPELATNRNSLTLDFMEVAILSHSLNVCQ
ncbi:NADH-quinone oxidoreductase subunit K [Mobiluncus mulieris]|nr:NADH-quinone oxidoreductase subunit K [Mobiluncus mulieris]